MYVYVRMFSHYAAPNNPQVLYIAVGTVAGVLLIVAIVVATLAIVVCCKKCILTKANLCKRLSPSTAAMDPENINATSTSVQEPQVEHKVREHHTVYNNACFTNSDHAVAFRPSKRRRCSCYDSQFGRQQLKLGRR